MACKFTNVIFCVYFFVKEAVLKLTHYSTNVSSK